MIGWEGTLSADRNGRSVSAVERIQEALGKGIEFE